MKVRLAVALESIPQTGPRRREQWRHAMANGDAALLGLTTRSTSTTNVQRVPPTPDPNSFVGPGILANGVLVGWNSSAIGDGVVGRAAPGAAGVRGIVTPGTPPVAG